MGKAKSKATLTANETFILGNINALGFNCITWNPWLRKMLQTKKSVTRMEKTKKLQNTEDKIQK